MQTSPGHRLKQTRRERDSRRPAGKSRDRSSKSRRNDSFSGGAEFFNPGLSLSAVTAIFLLHLTGLTLLFHPVSGAFNSAPVIDQDWGLHFHHLSSLVTFWRQDGRLWAYNPLFMAGYPSNTIQDLSIKLFEFAALVLALPGVAPIQGFKISVLLATASVPWLMYFSARNFFHDHAHRHRIAFFAALAGTIYWWNSLPREMFFYGMLGYPIGCYVALLGLSLVARTAYGSGSWSSSHVALIFFAVAILPLHLQAVLVFAPPLLALGLARPDLLGRGLAGWLLGAAALSLAVNLPWLAPALSHVGDDVSASIVEQLPLFLSQDPVAFVKDYLSANGYWTFRPSFWEKGLRLALLVLGATGIWRLLRSERKPLGLTLATAVVVLFITAYFGGLVPWTRGWQPLRFKVPLDLVLTIPASYLISLWRRPEGPNAGSLLIPLLSAGGALTFVVNLLATETSAKMRLRTEIHPHISNIVEWVRNDTPSNARVLFEESGDETGFVYDGTYLSSFLAHWTGRQLIGGPINYYNDRHHFAEFHSAQLFKKEIRVMPDEEIARYLRDYNIGAIVAFHPATVQRLMALSSLIHLDRRAGPVHLMTVRQPLSWFLEGSGNIHAGLNRIQASNVQGSTVILKYHWTQGIVSVPDAPIEAVMVNDDPIPFIKIANPPRSFTLRIGP